MFDNLVQTSGYQGYLQNNTIVPTRGCAFGATTCEPNPQPTNSTLPWYNHWYGGTPRFYIGSSSRFTGHPAYRATNLADDFSRVGFFARDFAVNTAEGWTNLDWWIRSNLPFGEGPGGGVSGKILRLWHHPDLVDQIVLVNMPNPVFIVDRGCTVHTNPDIQYIASYPLNQWTHLSVMTKVLSSGTEAHILVNGELVATVTGFCGNDGIYDYLRMVGLDPSVPENLDPNLEFLWGDIYFDDSLARVVISDSSTFDPFGGSYTNHYEVQNIQSWSNSSVTFKANPGSFTSGQTVYLYVIDSNGNVNTSGYPIQIASVLGNSVSSCNIPDQDTLNWSSLSNNILVRGCGPAIYVITNGQRLQIPNLEILRRDYPGQRVYNVSETLLGAYPIMY
jgi:hypothetical protein